MKKQLVLICLVALCFTTNVFCQTIYWAEGNNGRIRKGALNPVGIANATNLITGLNNPFKIQVAQNTSKLYYLNFGGSDLIRANLVTGAQELVVESMGAMAELADITYYPDDDAILAANGPEVQGLRYIPSNGSGGTDLNLGSPYDNDYMLSVAVNNDAGVVYFADYDSEQVGYVGTGGGAAIIVASLPEPYYVAMDDYNYNLYIVNYEFGNYYLHRYDIANGVLSQVANLGAGPIVDMEVYGKYNKAYFGVYDQGIYSVSLTGGALVQEIALAGAGNINVSIQHDLTNPTITALAPADNATGVTTLPTLTLTLIENIKLSTVTGTSAEESILIKRISDGMVVQTIHRLSGNIAIANNLVTITPTAALSANENYEILIGNKVLTDNSSNPFVGTLSGAWNFTTTPGVVSANPTATVCVGTYTNYPNIVLTESHTGNFKTGNQSLTFGSSSAGYTFESGVGTVAVTAGSDLTISSFSISNTLITINYTAAGTLSIDAITISGLKLQSSVSTNPPTSVIRNGGTAIAEGLVTNSVIGTVSTQAQPAAPGITFPGGNSICLDGNPASFSATASGSSLRWFTQNDLLPASLITALNDKVTVTAQELGVTTAAPATVNRFVRQNIGGCMSLSTPVDFIIEPKPVNIITVITPNTSCVGPNGSVRVSDVDGTGVPNYSMVWRDQSMVQIGTGPVLANISEGLYTLIVTNLSGCSSDPLIATVPGTAQMPALTFISMPNTNCATPNGTVNATIQNPVGPASEYLFTWYNGPDTSSPVNPLSTTSSINGVAGGTLTTKVLHIPSGCEGVASLTVTDSYTYPVASSPSGDVCETPLGSGKASLDLTTYNPTITGGNADLSVTWRDAVNNPITSAVVVTNDSYNYELRSASSGCVTTSSLAFTVHQAPTPANAGPDQNVCATTTTLAGNLPSAGAGTWAIVSGTGGTIVSPGSPNSVFNGVSGTTYVLEWIITTGSTCSVSVDQVTIAFNAIPSTPNAGGDQIVCNAPVTLGANTPAIGTGSWSVVAGAGGTFTNSALPLSGFTGTAGVVYTLRWTITGSCAANYDDVIITINPAPSTSVAGPDQNICGTTATLAANTPSTGTGSWSIISGAGGTVGNTASPTSSFTGLAGTTYTLRWTISSASCASSTDDVAITISAAPTVANAGADKNFCGTSIAMTANTPATGTGSWSVVTGGGGSFANTSSSTSIFTGTVGTTYTLRWTISNGSCAPSTDEVAVSLVAAPTAATAGQDQVVCATTATLAANTPVIGTGSWSIISGAGGTVTTPASSVSSFTGSADVAYTLRWTTTNGVCSASTDDVTISLTNPITPAQAGADQTKCGSSITLTGNTLSSGTGTWTIVTGSGGTISSPASPSSTFTGVAGSAYTLRWTVSKSGCNPSTDDVNITFLTAPQGTGTISPPADLCAGETATLSVNGFSNTDSYEWSVPSGISSESSTSSSIDITGGSAPGGTITVTPRNQCGTGTPASITIGVRPLPSVNIILPPSAFVEEAVSFSFSSDNTIQIIEWTLGDGTSSGDPAPQHAYGAAGEFEISLTLTSSDGCVNNASQTYTVRGEPGLGDTAIKNVITANGDDKNRVLYIRDLDRYPDNEVRFLDRWGVEIFSSSNYQNDWEARGKDGQFLPAGQYICIVKLKSTGKVFSRTVSIIKGR
jgi:hypothetical protein